MLSKTQFVEIFLKERDRMMESIENSDGPEGDFFVETANKIDNGSDELSIVLASIEDNDSLEAVYNKANGELNFLSLMYYWIRFWPDWVCRRSI